MEFIKPELFNSIIIYFILTVILIGLFYVLKIIYTQITIPKENENNNNSSNQNSNKSYLPYITLVIIGVGLAYVYFQNGTGGNISKNETINEMSDSFPTGMQPACFCAEALLGNTSLKVSGTQLKRCELMFICPDNAIKDCSFGTETAWRRCQRL
jgi:hypothetical protein